MVAPHETGDLVRSLVRVPGSGLDRNAGSECLDLARVSSLAASVPVPKNLPPALANSRAPQKVHESRNEKLLEKPGLVADGIRDNNEDRKRQLSQESSESVSLPKRARVVYMTPEQVRSNASRIVSVGTSAGPVLYMPLNPPATNSSLLALNEASVSQLIQERNTLRQENQYLQRQLHLFQQLFKDKKRLGSVVKRLGVKIP